MMGGVLYARRLASWICKRYLRYVLLGAVSSCISVNMALHMGAGLEYFCEDECLHQMMITPVSSTNRLVIQHIKDYWIDPPAPEGAFKGNFDIEHPTWAKIGRWGDAQKFIVNYFKNFQGRGTFIEVGAHDGEFMSLTLWLEQKMGYRGLLVEPNPYDYEKLLAKKRSSYSINACATPDVTHRKDLLWIRDTPGNLPELLRRIQQGSNRLISYVSLEDRDLGKTIPVQCFNLAAMAAAAFGRLSTDLVTISTHGGELDIVSKLPASLKMRVLVVMAPLSSLEENKELKAMGAERGLVLAYSQSNIHIFLPKGEVKIV